MGSKLVIDLLNFNSALGKCKVLIRDKVQQRSMDGSKDSNTVALSDTHSYLGTCVGIYPNTMPLARVLMYLDRFLLFKYISCPMYHDT